MRRLNSEDGACLCIVHETKTVLVTVGIDRPGKGVLTNLVNETLLVFYLLLHPLPLFLFPSPPPFLSLLAHSLPAANLAGFSYRHNAHTR